MNTRSKVLAAIGAVILALGLIVALRVTTAGGDNPGSSAAPRTPSTNNCTNLTIMASSEKADLLSALASEYNKSERSKKVSGLECVEVKVVKKASGAALDALSKPSWDDADGPRPDVWSPAASSWLRLLSSARASVDAPSISPSDAPSITSTPLVLAMPEPMAKVLGWPDKPLGWADVLSLAQNPQGWGAYGHPEWGAFKLGKTNPNFSTSGLNATVGAYFAATGLSSDLSVSNIKDPATSSFASAVESSVVHYGDTTLTFLSNLQRAADDGRPLSYISAVAVEEKSVWDYNQGNPTGDPKTLGKHNKASVRLVSFYPKEGTLFSDNPYAVLEAPWVGAEQRSAADDFYQFLTTPQSQSRFTALGFRTYDGKTGPQATLANGIIASEPSRTLSVPSPEVLAQIKLSWAEQRKRAHVILVMDVSGSMGDSSGLGRSKLEMAKDAALKALDQFADDDEVGLWIFSTDRDQVKSTPYAELVPVAPMATNKPDLVDKINSLTPDGGTALYATARASVSSAIASADPSKINAVVLLTDGRNEYPKDDDLKSLVSYLKDRSESASVKLFTIGYGKDADLKTLKSISDATDAASYDASDPNSIDSVFTSVISNF